MENTCERCGSSNIDVIDTRPSRSDFFSIRRRRRCLDCGYRFTTYEAKASQIVAIAYDIFRTYVYPQLLKQSQEQLQAVFEKADIDMQDVVKDTGANLAQRFSVSRGSMPEGLKKLANALENEGLI